MAEFDYSKASHDVSTGPCIFIRFIERRRDESRTDYLFRKLDEARNLANVSGTKVTIKGIFYYREILRLSQNAKLQSATIRSKTDRYLGVFTLSPEFSEH